MNEFVDVGNVCHKISSVSVRGCDLGLKISKPQIGRCSVLLVGREEVKLGYLLPEK